MPSVNGSPDNVIKITKVMRNGYYAPITASGSLIADGIVVSCYSESTNVVLQRIVYSVVLHLRTWFGALAVNDGYLRMLRQLADVMS